jgi:hypothetical protein
MNLGVVTGKNVGSKESSLYVLQKTNQKISMNSLDQIKSRGVNTTHAHKSLDGKFGRENETRSVDNKDLV